MYIEENPRFTKIYFELTLFNQEGSGQARGLWTDRDRPRFCAVIPTQAMLIDRDFSAGESVTMLRVL